MLLSLQTLPLNPHRSVNSTSQMSWSPMKWIVLCPSAGIFWMHSKRFTSISLSIWPSHMFTSLCTPTLTLRMRSSMQRRHAFVLLNTDYANELQLICGKSKVYKVIDEMLLNDVSGPLSFVYLNYLRKYWMMCYWIWWWWIRSLNDITRIDVIYPWIINWKMDC